MKSIFYITSLFVFFYAPTLWSQTSQTINEAALPRIISPDAALITAKLTVSSDTEARLGIDILDSNYDWYGGVGVPIQPGTSDIEVEIPIFDLMPIDGELFWNVFLTQPDSDWRTATKWGVRTPITLAEIEVQDFDKRIKILTAPTELKPNTNSTINVRHQSNQMAILTLDLVSEDNPDNVIAQTSTVVEPGVGTSILSLSLEDISEASLVYQARLDSLESEQSADSNQIEAEINEQLSNQYYADLETEVIPENGFAYFHYSFHADQEFQIAYDLFNRSTNRWVRSGRIHVPIGSGTANLPIDLEGLPPGDYRIANFLVPPGENWTQAEFWGRPLFLTIESTPNPLTAGEINFPQTWVDWMLEEEVTVDRRALVRMPAPTESGQDKKLPVVILLHGSFGNPEDMLELHDYIEDHIRIGCAGYRNDWNISFDATQAPDVDFIRRLILYLRTFDNVDRERITILGYSNGAGLLNRLMIELEDGLFQNAIAMAQQLRTIQYNNNQFWYDPNGRWDYTDTIVPPKGRRFLYLHGDSDDILNTEGVFVPDSSIQLWTTVSESVFAWAKALGNNPDEVSILQPEDGVEDPEGFTYSYRDGQVQYYLIKNADHTMSTPENGLARMEYKVLQFLETSAK